MNAHLYHAEIHPWEYRPRPMTSLTAKHSTRSQAKDTQLVEYATEIKVRAERRAGEMLAEIPRNPNGGRPKENQTTLARLLDENDIAPTTAKRWQKLAAIPERTNAG